MNHPKNTPGNEMKPSGSTAPVWWLVFKRELAELWIGGRALNLLILFTVLMSITAFLLATNSELSLFTPQRMLYVTLQANITFGLFIGLIIAAESISGERERATLEGLLLTPTSRRQLVVGKFLAALSLWPAALILSIPYMAVLSQGDPVLGPALLWGGLLGTILAAAFTGFGMLVSIWSNSSRTSLFASLLIYLLSLLPSQLPGETQATPLGAFVQAANPLEATRQFLQKILMEGRPLDEVNTFFLAPALLTIVILGALFLFAAPRLRLEAGRLSLRRLIWSRSEAIE